MAQRLFLANYDKAVEVIKFFNAVFDFRVNLANELFVHVQVLVINKQPESIRIALVSNNRLLRLTLKPNLPINP